MSDAIAFLKRAIEQGQGLAEADLVLQGRADFRSRRAASSSRATLPSATTALSERWANIAGRREIDVSGKIVVPGFIDTHCHVESSLLTPLEFDRCVLRHGVTTSICDPHEIANVLGLAGLHYFLDAAMLTAMDLRIQLSSCVPATALETSGARLEADDLLTGGRSSQGAGSGRIRQLSRCACPRSLPASPSSRPSRPGRSTDTVRSSAASALNGYLSAGPRTDHEVTNLPEAKRSSPRACNCSSRRLGEQGSACARAMITERNSPFIALCTDDRNPLDIAEEGHLDFMIRTAIRLGAPPLAAYRAATISAARIFGLGIAASSRPAGGPISS